MTKKAKLLVVFILAVASIVGSVFAYKVYRKNRGVYVETVKQGKDTWGYKIYVKGKLVVNQPMMPAVPGNIPFPCEEGARKTAELVVQKVGRGDLPSVTKQEVDSIVKESCK
ncbi:MAG: hypothetical protein BGN96_02475 [Bacteroidales bacterium 45-6]|nr:MAG: hypothetical protein BGN96_02475 [Bacteroidales bacterium 45-6]